MGPAALPILGRAQVTGLARAGVQHHRVGAVAHWCYTSTLGPSFQYGRYPTICGGRSACGAIDDPVVGAEGRHLIPPIRPRAGEAVEQHERRAVRRAMLLVVHAHVIDPDKGYHGAQLPPAVIARETILLIWPRVAPAVGRKVPSAYPLTTPWQTAVSTKV